MDLEFWWLVLHSVLRQINVTCNCIFLTFFIYCSSVYAFVFEGSAHVCLCNEIHCSL